MRWTLGLVTRHEECRKCGGELTRLHAADCSGASAILAEKYADLQGPEGRATWLDVVLNHFRNTPPDETEAYADVSAAVSLIYVECRRLSQQPNGYWVDENAPARQPRARRAYDRNRPHGPTPLGRPRARGGIG